MPRSDSVANSEPLAWPVPVNWPITATANSFWLAVQSTTVSTTVAPVSASLTSIEYRRLDFIGQTPVYVFKKCDALQAEVVCPFRGLRSWYALERHQCRAYGASCWRFQPARSHRPRNL